MNDDLGNVNDTEVPAATNERNNGEMRKNGEQNDNVQDELVLKRSRRNVKPPDRLKY